MVDSRGVMKPLLYYIQYYHLNEGIGLLLLDLFQCNFANRIPLFQQPYLLVTTTLLMCGIFMLRNVEYGTYTSFFLKHY